MPSQDLNHTRVSPPERRIIVAPLDTLILGATHLRSPGGTVIPEDAIRLIVDTGLAGFR